MNDADVLGLHVAPGQLLVRWSGRVEEIAAAAVESDDGEALESRVRYAAAAVGAPSGTGTAVVVHPTHWNARRRERLHIAARSVARNAVLVPVSVAARCAVEAHGEERCVVLEATAQGVTATLVRVTPEDGPVVVRVARDPDLGLDLLEAQDGADALSALIRSVAGTVEPDVLIVTGEPGEPQGAPLCGRIAGRIGRGIRVVAVAAVEMLAVVAVPSESPIRETDTTTTAQWLQDTRATLPSPASARRLQWMPVVAAVLVVAVAVAVLVTAGKDYSHGGDSDGAATVTPEQGISSGTDEGVAETTGPASDGAPSRRFALGPVRLDLPSRWRVRDTEARAPKRTELLPDSGPDRRIVLVYSHLDDGMDRDAVARVLAERVSRRSGVIRDLDPDTRFGDRPVIAYVEVPDEFSTVRWFVVVESGLQIAVGCQFLTDEWTGIRSECEQAVHTVEVE